MMTKKCYQKIASILAKYKDINITAKKDIHITAVNEEENEDILPISVIIEDFIVMFKEDNPRFNEEKFKKAIYGEGKI